MPNLFNVESEIQRVRRENYRDREQRLVLLGDGLGGAWENLYADKQHLWVRDIGGKSTEGTNTPAGPYRVLAGMGYTPRINAQVYIQYQPGPCEWQVIMSDPIYMDQTKESMHLVNPTDPHNQYQRTESFLPLLSSPISGMIVNVQGWQTVTTDGIYIEYPGTSDDGIAISQHIDLTSSAPVTAAHHLYALLAFNLTLYQAGVTNPIEVFVSTSQSWATNLDKTDIQECIDQMSPNSVTIKAYRLKTGQETIRGDASDRDLRDWLNRPHLIPVRTIASATDPGVPGEHYADADFFYHCYAVDSWNRYAKSAW